MNPAKKERLFSIIAAVCFALYAVVNVIYYLYENTINDNLYFSTWGYINIAFFLIVAILLFIGKKKIPILVFLAIYSVIALLASYKIIFALIYTIVLVIGILSTGRSKVQMPTTICIIPVGIYLIYAAYNAYSILFTWREYYDIAESVVLISILILECLGILFTCLWYRTNLTFETKSTRAEQINNLIGSADSIRKYKELLDSGVITQEEFAEKKKQIIGE